MKTINMFGRKMPIVAILMALLVVGTASAAVVSYLGNDAKVNVTVESPFEVRVSTDNETWVAGNMIDLGTIQGGETSEFWFKYENIADQDIDMYIISTIYCNGAEIGFEDFEDDNYHSGDCEYGIILDVDSNEYGNLITDAAINCDYYMTDDGDTLVLDELDYLISTFDSGEVVTAHVIMHHAPGATGIYTITTQVMDDSYIYPYTTT